MKDRRFNNTDKLNMAVWVVLMLTVLFTGYYLGYVAWVFMDWLTDWVSNVTA